MKTILFIIPLISQKHCKNWDETCFYLNRTLTSIEGQESDSYYTLIVCNETPNLSQNFKNTTILNTNIIINKPYCLNVGRIDKQQKVYRGLIYTRDLIPNYVMILDADDLIHKNLVSYTNQNSKYDGFIINKGFRHDIGKSKLAKLHWFHLVSGSSVIFPYDPHDFETYNKTSYMNFYMTKIDHNKNIEKDFRTRNIKYKKVPFFAAIYTRGHGGHLRDVGVRPRVPSIKQKMDRLRKIISRLSGKKTIDDHIIRDFPGITTIT